MKTYSASEFKKLYGEQAYGDFAGISKNTRPSLSQILLDPLRGGVNNVKNIASGVAQDFKEGGQNIIEDINKTSTSLDYNPQEKQNVGTTILSTVGQISKTAFSPFTEILKSASTDISNNTPQEIKDTVGGVTSKISTEVQPLVDKYNEIASKNPELAKDFENAINVAMLLGGKKAEPSVVSGAEKTLKTVSDATKSGLNKAKTGVADTIESAGAKVQDSVNAVKEKIKPTTSPQQQFLSDVTPSYSKKLISEPPVKNIDGTITPRVQEGGVVNGRTVTPTALEKEASLELAKVPNYPLNGTSLEKYQSIQPEITSRSKFLMESLKNEKILRPPQQIKKVVSDAINKVPDESLLLQKSDPVIQNYLRVVENAIKKTDGTLAGEFRVRQLLDDAYKNARGKMAFGSDKLSALDDIHTAARDALNSDVISKAKNVDVKASLRSQWNLMRASDVLKSKAEAEAGSIIGRIQQKYPITTKLVKGASKVASTVAGIGTVVP